MRGCARRTRFWDDRLCEVSGALQLGVAKQLQARNQIHVPRPLEHFAHGGQRQFRMLPRYSFGPTAVTTLDRLQYAAVLLLGDEDRLADVADVPLRHDEGVRRGEGQGAHVVERSLQNEALRQLRQIPVKALVD